MDATHQEAGNQEAGARAVADLLRAYYQALEAGAPLAPFYATDEEAGEFGPVVKIGSGTGEEFRGAGAVRAAVDRVVAALQRNRLDSRALVAHARDDVGWFSDLVHWSGESEGEPFASLTRWTGVCLRVSGDEGEGRAAWRLLQLHVSEGV